MPFTRLLHIFSLLFLRAEKKWGKANPFNTDPLQYGVIFFFLFNKYIFYGMPGKREVKKEEAFMIYWLTVARGIF